MPKSPKSAPKADERKKSARRATPAAAKPEAKPTKSAREVAKTSKSAAKRAKSTTEVAKAPKVAAKPKSEAKPTKSTAKPSKPTATKTIPAQFQGFPAAAIEFLRELEANNHREWFTANKSRYEMNLRRPFEALASDLEPELGSAKVFRIYNDVRFAKGKPPYKTHGSVVFEDRRGLVYYVHLEKDHLFVATGMHAMLPDQVRRFLDAAIDPKHGARLAKVVTNAESDGLEIGGEVLKTVARGYPKDHPNARFLRHKGLTTSVRYELAPWMHEPAAVERVRDVFARSAEVNDWLATHVGRSEEGARWVKH